MKTTIGGDRLGSGNKQELSLRNYERSTHDLSYIWRSSMSAGTLVPFLNKVALPGDSWEINLNCEVLTLPTLGPLFGSFKVQLDVFEVPMRLYNAKLHMNILGVGMDMSEIYLPMLNVYTNNHANYVQTFDDNEHINPSCLLKYLGFSGLGYIYGSNNPAVREINAVPLLAYWDIYKNYYANKQEEIGYFIHTDTANLTAAMTPERVFVYDQYGHIIGNALGETNDVIIQAGYYCEFEYPSNAVEPDPTQIRVEHNDVEEDLDDSWTTFTWFPDTKILRCETYKHTMGDTFAANDEESAPVDELEPIISLESFNLSNIDDLRQDILQYAGAGAFDITVGIQPYTCFNESVGADDLLRYCSVFNQEGLGIKTYQSDLFNNWIETEWIEGANGVNELSKIDTSGGDFTIETLNLAQKVYVMLNRIAVSGGSYDDWLNAVYTHERVKGVESPVYHGSLIKELSFQEVVSNSDSSDNDNSEWQPLGTLAGRGRLTDKHKGGKINIKVDEPAVLMGIVSLTPRIDYSQGNDWTVNLKTYDDFHKPALDAIGFQDLIAEQLNWKDSQFGTSTRAVTTHSIGKQPAWVNYMTSVNRVYGNFADQNKDMFMVLNRRYGHDATGLITDATTYIDPSKFNHIFAQTSIDSQNFWVQIAANITARRKMSAKQIPNL